MDFFEIDTEEVKGKLVVRPNFVVDKSEDLMVKGGAFYAVWDEKKGLWSTSEFDLRRIVDDEIRAYVEQALEKGIVCTPKYLRNFNNNGWKTFKQYVKTMSDNAHDLDTKVVFANSKVNKTDYATRRLSYDMAPGEIKAYEELVNVLYSPEEREKFEWYIGAIISGDASTKKIQKFLVFYGDPGTGKSTIMDITTKIFGGEIDDKGYVATFNAKSLVNGNQFGTEAFRTNPLIAIQHDGDLSKIEDNALLNSIVSRESIMINEKFKSQYKSKIRTALMLGTNKTVRISDAKSGLIRRLIDVHPTGKVHSYDDYQRLIALVDFEIAAIAHHCLEVYRRLTRSYYNGYEPTAMILNSDYFRNFIEFNYDTFKEQDSTTLKRSYAMFKDYANEAQIDFKVKMYHFRDELKNYFHEFHDRYQHPDGKWDRSYYKGFKMRTERKSEIPTKTVLHLDAETSLLDDLLADHPAQYAKASGLPQKYWTDAEKLRNGEPYKPKKSEVVSTILSDLDTSKLHYVKVPENLIVIDFDLTDENGAKSLELNLEAASTWPPTYTELSKGGEGLHLHYFWDGDVTELKPLYSPGIEVKTLLGDSALRRRLSKCNDIPVRTISTGLPLKEKQVLNDKVLKSERGLRDLLERCLRKEWGGTFVSVQFMNKILSDAYKSNMVYNVEDMKPRILLFAAKATNQGLEALRIAKAMPYVSEVTAEEADEPVVTPTNDQIVFFDVEVYPNLVLVCWKYQGSKTVTPMINPSPRDIEQLLEFKLIGFNNINYDNHILWAILMGWTTEQIYELSQKLVSKDKSRGRAAKFTEAHNISWGDIFDFATKKQGLKKWEIELGLKHMEMDIPWDEPVPPEKLEQVVEYCSNDVDASEAVFNHCAQDWMARLIMADLSGLTPNHGVRHHITKIIFGDNRNPQSTFNYVKLGEELFPGYEFDPFAEKDKKSTYRGETVGEGGYVYAEPGMYEDVALLDVASMHPTSIVQMDAFGPYTRLFHELMTARLEVKQAASCFDKGNPERGRTHLANARGMFDGRLQPYLDTEDVEELEALADAMKLGINSTYGFTCAGFENPFKDPRNIDNVVAKRGALFMVDLKYAVQERGFTVAHIKTDSIKIPNATPEIIEFVKDFGKRYGYTFEHEATYRKFCLVNNAVFIAQLEKPDKKGRLWKAVGAQFQNPYVYKTLFTGEPIYFEDLGETKSVANGAVMYLVFEDGTTHHVGKTGSFIPVNDGVEGFHGGHLMRKDGDLWHAVGGTKDHLWLETEMIKTLKHDSIDRLVFEGLAEALEGTGSIADIIDMTFYEDLAEKAKATIEKFGDFEAFAEVS
jgi:hypothetical protein